MFKSQNQTGRIRKWVKYAICSCLFIGLLTSNNLATAEVTETQNHPIDMISTEEVIHSNSIKLLLNGTELKTAVKPYVENQIGYVPLQTILNALEYKYKVNKNKNTITVSIGSRVSVLTLDSQVIMVNGKKITVKGKVKKVGGTFVVSADTITRILGRGVAGYYSGQNAVSIRVPVNVMGSQATREKYSSSYQVERISFDIPTEWAKFIRINGPRVSDLTDQELQVTIDWVENGVTTFLAAIFIRDEYNLTNKQWEKWFTEGLEQRLLKQNGVMFSYITTGDPTEELLKPENEALFEKIAGMINNNELADVLRTIEVTYR